LSQRINPQKKHKNKNGAEELFKPFKINANFLWDDYLTSQMRNYFSYFLQIKEGQNTFFVM